MEMLQEHLHYLETQEMTCHTCSSIYSYSMMCGCLTRRLAHMQITQERHLLFCLHESSLLVPCYFTVTQLVLAQGPRCALHSALGNQCSL